MTITMSDRCCNRDLAQLSTVTVYYSFQYLSPRAPEVLSYAWHLHRDTVNMESSVSRGQISAVMGITASFSRSTGKCCRNGASDKSLVRGNAPASWISLTDAHLHLQQIEAWVWCNVELNCNTRVS